MGIPAIGWPIGTPGWTSPATELAITARCGAVGPGCGGCMPKRAPRAGSRVTLLDGAREASASESDDAPPMTCHQR